MLFAELTDLLNLLRETLLESLRDLGVASGVGDLASLGVGASVVNGVGKLVLDALGCLVLNSAGNRGRSGVRGALALLVGETVGDVGRHDVVFCLGFVLKYLD